jgi:hypothetical protein
LEVSLSYGISFSILVKEVNIMDDNEYLKLILKDKKLKLEHLHVENQKHISVFESKRDMLISDIESLEKQISRRKP